MKLNIPCGVTIRRPRDGEKYFRRRTPISKRYTRANLLFLGSAKRNCPIAAVRKKGGYPKYGVLIPPKKHGPGYPVKVARSAMGVSMKLGFICLNAAVRTETLDLSSYLATSPF